MKEKRCSRCGETFKPKVGHQKYCSPACNAAANHAASKKWYHDHKKSSIQNDCHKEVSKPCYTA